jgi:hypothetical protein
VDGPVAIPYIPVIEGVKMVGAPPGEVAPVTHPMGLMGACEWAVPVAFEHLVALVTGGGGPMDVHCISEVRGAGGGHSS